MVGEVGVATSSNFNAVICPTVLKTLPERKGQFSELSNGFSALTTEQISADGAAPSSALKTAVNPWMRKQRLGFYSQETRSLQPD